MYTLQCANQNTVKKKKKKDTIIHLSAQLPYMMTVISSLDASHSQIFEKIMSIVPSQATNNTACPVRTSNALVEKDTHLLWDFRT